MDGSDLVPVPQAMTAPPTCEEIPQQGWAKLTLEEQQKWLQQLQKLYYEIILLYFRNAPHVHERIARFTYVAYRLNVPISEILGIHVQFMDEITKQLKLEGRSEELVLDYRLTLIDVIAHLCERYRRAMVEKTGEEP
ncbi:circadian clock protein KaiA [Gloeomargarita sp.]